MNDARLAERLAAIRHVAVDLDGTVYKDGDPFPCTGPFLDALDALGIGYTFLSNNCSRNTDEYVAHLQRIGIRASRDNVYTSSDAMVHFLRAEAPRAQRLFILGTTSLESHFAAFGYTVCSDDPEDEPDAVVVGFDTGLTYRRLCRAAYWVARGKSYFATHPDRVCPTKEKTLLVDCGAICTAINTATGRQPEVVPGKPDRWMLEGILRRRGIRPDQLAMAGDRLYTDMAMARVVGALGVLVLTGEATAEEAKALNNPPDLILRDLGEFGALLLQHGRSDCAKSASKQPAATACRATGTRNF